MKNYYKLGDWNLICDSCGKKIKASHSRHRWDGFIVCDRCFEHRHPQDFVRSKVDKITVPFSRPRSEDSFVFTCDIPSSSAYVGLAVADCAKANTTYGYSYLELLSEFLCSYEKQTGIAGVGYAGCCKPMFNADAYF